MKSSSFLCLTGTIIFGLIVNIIIDQAMVLYASAKPGLTNGEVLAPLEFKFILLGLNSLLLWSGLFMRDKETEHNVLDNFVFFISFVPATVSFIVVILLFFSYVVG